MRRRKQSLIYSDDFTRTLEEEEEDGNVRKKMMKVKQDTHGPM